MENERDRVMNTDFFDNNSCLAYTFAVCQQFEQFYKEANLADQNLAEAKSEQINVDDKSLQLTYKLTDLLDIRYGIFLNDREF